MSIAEAPPIAAPQVGERTHRWLLAATTVFAVAVVLHNGDHVRRGADAVEADVFWIGTLGIGLEVLLVVWVCQRHRLAALAAAVLGGGLAVGYVVVHFTPERSWLSDSLSDGRGIDALTWGAASLEVVAALLLAAVGAWAVRERGGLAAVARPVATSLPLRAGLLHPVALAFIASQLVVIVVSFAQR